MEIPREAIKKWGRLVPPYNAMTEKGLQDAVDNYVPAPAPVPAATPAAKPTT